MSRAPDLPRLVNFSDSDMSTDSDSDDEGKECTNIITSGNPYLVKPDESNNPQMFKDKDYGQISDPSFCKKEIDSKCTEGAASTFGESSLGLSKYDDVGGSKDRRSSSRGRRSRSWARRSRSASPRSTSRGRRSGSRGRRSSSRGRRSRSRSKRSSSRYRSRSRDRRSGSRGRRSGSKSRRSESRSRRSRSRSRDRRRRSHSGSKGRYRRSRSRSRGKHRRSRSGSRRRKDRRHSSPRRSRRISPQRAFRTLDTLEKLGIELKPAAPPEEPQPPIPSYYNKLAVNPNKYAQQMAKRKLLWGGKTTEEGTAKASNWQGATFSQDQDGKMSAKFKRLMGIKGDVSSNTAEGEVKGQDLIKRQQELFSTMELQYEAARQATHTQRGVGLGFSSHPHHFPS